MSGRQERSHPERIGRYRLLQELGRGSYGVVYLAERDGDQARFAIKVLTDRAVENDEAMARFKLEARVASKIDDPGVVAIHETGRVGPRPYYVMEYFAGPTLYQHLKQRGRLPPDEAVEIVARLARILAATHAQGVIHRDLKPANVILSEPDGEPRVTDFGLAQDRAHHQRLTRTGDVVGTPYYMASEQIRGANDIDARVDVYALGVILYELLAGERPYQAPTLVEVSQLVNAGAAAPLTEKAPGTPPALIAIVARAMAVDRDERTMDALSLAEELETFARGGAPEAAPSSRKGLLIGAGLIVLLVGIALAIGLPIAKRQAELDQARALLTEASARTGDARDLLTRAAELAQGEPELLAEVEAELARRDAEAWVRRLRGRVSAGGSAAEIRALLDGAPASDALRAARDELARAALAQGRPQVAAALAEGNPALAAEIQATQDTRAGQADLTKARELAAAGDPDGARALLRSARDRLPAGPLAETIKAELASLDALRDLAGIPRLLRNPSPWPEIERVLSAAEKRLGSSAALQQQLTLWRVRMLRLRGRYEAALEAAAPLLGLQSPVGYEARWQRAMALFRLQRHSECTPDLRKLAQEDPEGVWGLTALALVLFSADGKPQDAVTAAARAVRLDGDAIEARLTLAFALLNANRLDESQAQVDHVVRRIPAHPRAHLGLAFLAQRRQQYDDALEAYTRVIHLTGPHGMPLALQQRGVAYRHLKRHELALADLDAALARVPTMIQARIVRAAIYQGLGRTQEAEADWRLAAKQDFPTFERLLATQIGPHLARRICETMVDDPVVTRSVPAPPALTYAPGLLGQAQKRAREGAAAATVLATLAKAESQTSDPKTRLAIRLERADLLWRRGRYEDAIQAATPLLSTPAGLRARYLIGFSRLWQLRYPEGLAELKRVHTEDPDGVVGNTAGAAWLSYSRRNPEGEALARKAIQLDPTWIDPYLSLAFCLSDQGKRLSALSLMKRVLPCAPDHPRAHMASAMIQAGLRLNRASLEALGKVIALTEPQPALRALASRARQLYNARAWKRAIADTDRYLKRVPNDTSALLFLRGMAHLRLANRPRALADMREYGRRNPQSFQQLFQRMGPQDQQAIRDLLRRGTRR